MTRALCAAAVACALALSVAPANAKPRHQMPRNDSQAIQYCPLDGTYRSVCGQPENRIQRVARASVSSDETVIIGGRPHGCPRQYCGCGAARYLGLNDARLNLAWNWAKLFPRTSPGPGMAVVWRHHVALIEQMVGPREALLRDYNSGKGLSRLHVRSIAGAVVVNPHSRVASR